MKSSVHRYAENMELVSVVVLSSDSTCIKGRLNTIEEIICFKSGRPYLMTIKGKEDSRKKFNYRIQKSEEITEEEYRKLLASHT